jgi:5-methylthioadenosine/S-adenosylhomocysteine deaminase
MHVDLIISGRWLVPVVPESMVLENHSIVINEDRILDILPTDKVSKKYSTTNQQDLNTHVLIPGLINTHTHAAMSLFKGLADDLPLMDWLNNHIWPAESKHVNQQFVADGTRLAVAEMIRGGITTFNDMYFFPDITAEVASSVGMRVCIGLIVIDFPTAWANDTQEYFDKGQQVHDSLRHHPLIKTAFAPHAPYTVSDQPLQKVAVLAEELDIPIHMHIHETEFEVNQSIENHGINPLKRLESLGLLSQRLLAVHMTQLDQADIDLIQKYNVNIIHCPESNLKLAAGFCPVKTLADAGINVSLGTDGSASNNDLNILGEMRTAALMSKGLERDPCALPAMEVLKMATINAAKALDMADQIGSLEIGKSADVVAINLETIESLPVYDPISQLVYASDRNQVTDVWVAGKQILNERTLTTMEVNQLHHIAKTWHSKISTR